MKFLLIIPAIIIAIIIGLSIFLQPNDFVGCSDKPSTGDTRCSKADAIVVVSGGDTNARTDAGIELYQNGWAGKLIFSGAAQDKSGPSNAAAMESRAMAAGIPESDILIEEFSETTQQNAANTQSIFAENGFNKVILVTSGYHQRRANIEFERRASDVTILNYPLTNDDDWSALWWLTPRGWWLAVGEIVKIIISAGQEGVTSV